MNTSITTEEHELFRETFGRLVAAGVTPNVEAWEQKRAVPRDLWLKMGEQGFLCPWLPEQYDGLELDFGYSVIINQELIRGDGFGGGVPLHNDVATPYIADYGTDEGP